MQFDMAMQKAVDSILKPMTLAATERQRIVEGSNPLRTASVSQVPFAYVKRIYDAAAPNELKDMIPAVWQSADMLPGQKRKRQLSPASGFVVCVWS